MKVRNPGILSNTYRSKAKPGGPATSVACSHCGKSGTKAPLQESEKDHFPCNLSFDGDASRAFAFKLVELALPPRRCGGKSSGAAGFQACAIMLGLVSAPCSTIETSWSILASLALRRSSNPRFVGETRFAGESPICIGAVELGLSRGCSSTLILFLKARPFTGIFGLRFNTSTAGVASGADDVAACRKSDNPRSGDKDLASGNGAAIPSGGPVAGSRSGRGGLLTAGRGTSPGATLTTGRSGRIPSCWPFTIRAAARLADSAKAMFTRSICGQRSRGISMPSPLCLLCQCCSFFSMTSWNTCSLME
mmetsp:Transcript_28411/g.73496  ORF Transcript_28411/g.73496 Transcript_28411/m.73496 type:complete len:307 (+) Transcript_28411:56-976(+)